MILGAHVHSANEGRGALEARCGAEARGAEGAAGEAASGAHAFEERRCRFRLQRCASLECPAYL